MKLVRADHLAWRRIDEETLVVDLSRRRVYGLNSPGGLVWQGIVEAEPNDEIERQLVGAGVPPDQVRAALGAFVGELVGLGLVAAEGSGAAEPQTRPGPPPGSGAPQVLWGEELRIFAGSCSRTPAGGPTCTQGQFFS